MRGVFVDADFIISAFDNQATGRSDEQITQAKQQFKDWLSDEQVSLFTNPLVKHEVLRAIQKQEQTERYTKLETAFTEIEILDIGEADASLATELWQYAKRTQSFKPDTRTFDLLHFACAHNNQLEIASQNRKEMNTLALALENYKKQP